MISEGAEGTCTVLHVTIHNDLMNDEAATSRVYTLSH
jgi:hypothetical protein